MTTTEDLRIDHHKDAIVSVSDRGEETRVIQSKVEKQPELIAGVRSMTPYESQVVPADVGREQSIYGPTPYVLR